MLCGLHRQNAEDVTSRTTVRELLDIGNEPEQLALLIARRAPGLRVADIDLSPDMVRLASGHVEAAGAPGAGPAP